MKSVRDFAKCKLSSHSPHPSLSEVYVNTAVVQRQQSFHLEKHYVFALLNCGESFQIKTVRNTFVSR